MKRPLNDVVGHRPMRSSVADVAGRPLHSVPLDYASYRHAIGGGASGDDPSAAPSAEEEAQLLADFADFMSGADVFVRGEAPVPDPLFRERLRRRLWQTHLLRRGLGGPEAH